MKSVDKAGRSGLGNDVELVDLSGSGMSIINSEVYQSEFVF